MSPAVIVSQHAGIDSRGCFGGTVGGLNPRDVHVAHSAAIHRVDGNVQWEGLPWVESVSEWLENSRCSRPSRFDPREAALNSGRSIAWKGDASVD